jgi:hypothetical protein
VLKAAIRKLVKTGGTGDKKDPAGLWISGALLVLETSMPLRDEFLNAATFLPQQGQGAALINGSAPWPVAPTMHDDNRQAPVATG